MWNTLNKQDEKYLAMALGLAEGDAKRRGDMLGSASQDGLYKCFHRITWGKLSEAGRLRLLQEFENRQAKLDGRRAITIRTEDMPENSRGYHQILRDGTETVVINLKLIKAQSATPFQSFSTFTAADALETVIHEGRHAFQHNAIKQKSDQVSEQARLEWRTVMGEFGGVYMPPEENFLVYVMQSIEMDARRFARRKIRQIGDRLAELGMGDIHFTITGNKLLANEKRYLAWVREQITLEQIDLYEKKVLDHYRRNHPEAKVDHLKIFDHVRFIINRKDIDNMAELVELLDREADKLIDAKPEKKLDSCIETLPGMAGRFGG